MHACRGPYLGEGVGVVGHEGVSLVEDDVILVKHVHAGEEQVVLHSILWSQHSIEFVQRR